MSVQPPPQPYLPQHQVEHGPPPHPQLQPLPGRPGPLRTAWALVHAVIERVLLSPLREGRLRVRGPRGYTAMVLLGGVAILLALAGALLGPALRHRLALVPTAVGIDGPSEPAGALLALLVLAVALIHTAALHAPVWGRIAGVAVSVVFLCGVAAQGLPAGAGRALAACAAAVVMLTVLQVVRWWSRSAWWEFVVVLATYALATGVALVPMLRAGTGIGAGSQLETLWVLLISVASFATPVVLVASLSVAQVGLRAAAWGTRGLRVMTPGWLALLVCVLVLGYRATVDVAGWVDTIEGSATRIAGGAAFLTACAIAWGAVAWLGRRRSRRPVGELTGDLTAIALPLAAFVSAGPLLNWLTLFPLSLLDSIASATGNEGLAGGVATAEAVVDALATVISGGVVGMMLVVALLLAAVVLAVRGWPGPSGFVAVLAVVQGTTIWTGLEVPTYYLPLVVTALAVLALVVLLITGRLTTRRLESITLLGLLTTLLQLRDIFDEPLTPLLGGAAGVLAAMAWAFLTGGGVTEQAQGRRSRAAWFLGYTLIGFTAVAFAALAGSPKATFDAQAVSQQGDELFGTAILMTAIVACLGSIMRDRDLGQLS